MNSDKTNLNNTTVEEYLRAECDAMTKYAFGSGLKVPSDLVQNLQLVGEKASPPDLKELAIIHDQLSKIVEPAKPRSILLLENESRKKSIFKLLGPVPFIRRMTAVAILSLIVFIIISLSPQIDASPDNWDPFKSSGIGLLIRELFLLAAASLGVSFISLFKANRYIVEGKFDPTYESTYWIRYILGIIAGFLLAMLIPIEASVKSDFAKPLLSLLGGFSTDVVYQILNRLVEALKSVLSGDIRAIVESQKQNLKAQIEGENLQNRFRLASELMKMQRDMGENVPDEIKQKMTQLTDQLLPTSNITNPSERASV